MIPNPSLHDDVIRRLQQDVIVLGKQIKEFDERLSIIEENTASWDNRLEDLENGVEQDGYLSD